MFTQEEVWPSMTLSIYEDLAMYHIFGIIKPDMHRV